MGRWNMYYSRFMFYQGVIESSITPWFDYVLYTQRSCSPLCLQISKTSLYTWLHICNYVHVGLHLFLYFTLLITCLCTCLYTNNTFTFPLLRSNISNMRYMPIHTLAFACAGSRYWTRITFTFLYFVYRYRTRITYRYTWHWTPHYHQADYNRDRVRSITRSLRTTSGYPSYWCSVLHVRYSW